MSAGPTARAARSARARRIAEVRRAARRAEADRIIRRLLAAAPALRPEQRARLAPLADFRGVACAHAEPLEPEPPEVPE
jgi:hypothetical protein